MSLYAQLCRSITNLPGVKNIRLDPTDMSADLDTYLLEDYPNLPSVSPEYWKFIHDYAVVCLERGEIDMHDPYSMFHIFGDDVSMGPSIYEKVPPSCTPEYYPFAHSISMIQPGKGAEFDIKRTHVFAFLTTSTPSPVYVWRWQDPVFEPESTELPQYFCNSFLEWLEFLVRVNGDVR